MAVGITHNLLEVNKRLADIVKNEEFARVVALTGIAKKIQLVVREQLDEKFDIKRTWVPRQIKIVPATKLKLQSEVFSFEPYLGVQDVGGKRTDRDEYHVPGSDFERMTGINPKKKVIPKRFRVPKGTTDTTLIFNQRFKIEAGARGKNIAKAFRTRLKSGAEVVAVRRTAKPNPLAILWLIVKRPIDIKGTKYFEEEAEGAYDRDFQGLYEIAYDKFVLGKG